jgi:general secretion pathway protein G
MQHDALHNRNRPSDAPHARPRRPGPRPRRGPAAFTLIEILIVVVILGILAAIVVPQFSNASHVARENTLKDELRYLRTQIAVFKAQHRDSPPGYPGGSTAGSPTEALFIAQMTKYSNARCATVDAGDAAHPLGPYLQKMPTNPLTNVAKVLIVANGAPMPTTYQGATYGWIYKPQTQELVVNSDQADSNGVPYLQY